MSYSLAFSQAILTTVFVADKVRLGHFDFVPTKQISEALNIPAPSAVKILNGLSREGIIETREGAKGGVRLARQAKDITVLDILNAIESNRPLFRTDFNVAVSGERPTRVQNTVRGLLNQAEKETKKHLKNKTVQELIDVSAR